MGEGPPQPPLPPPQVAPRLRACCWLLLILFLCNAAPALGHEGHNYAVCDLDACTRAYDVSLQSRGLSAPEGSAAFCGVLYDFGTCMYGIRRACRGNLNYHTSNTMLIYLKERFDCARRLKLETGSVTGVPPRKHGHHGRPAESTATTPRAPVTTTAAPDVAVPECSYRGGRSFRHCGLFGVPHLKTFHGAMQTCRVQGAWPLVDNPYLAVQVTNEDVLPGDSRATATTKVTVLVKGSSTPCTPQKTYEATADAPLPDTFIDGTNKSGHGEAVTVHHSETAYGASVQIHIRYIETTVIVRKVGRYLSFSTRMPEELASWGVAEAEAEDGGARQLCVEGCPLSERMDLASDRGHVLSWADALAKCVAKTPTPGQPPSHSPSDNEVLGDLTDQYLDWCVFDLMTTGRDDFVLAARSAHRDTLTMDPAHNLRNRTTAQDVGAGAAGAASSGNASGSASASAASALLALALCSVLALVSGAR